MDAFRFGDPLGFSMNEHLNGSDPKPACLPCVLDMGMQSFPFFMMVWLPVAYQQVLTGKE